MVIDPRSSEQHPEVLQRIFDTKDHAFLLAGSRVLGNTGVTDNKKWYFKGDNTPEVVKFLKENNFQVGMTPYYMSPISMTVPVVNLRDELTPVFPQASMLPLSMGAWTQAENQEFAGVMVNRAIYLDRGMVVVIDLIDNFKEYTEGLMAILADREKYGPKTFSSQESIDVVVNIATSVMAQLKRTPDAVYASTLHGEIGLNEMRDRVELSMKGHYKSLGFI